MNKRNKALTQECCNGECIVCHPLKPGDSRSGAIGIIPVKDELTPEHLAQIRQFASGATRDTEEGKHDFEAFLSPLVLVRYADYMHEHREQSDGQLRDGDNWQKGIPKDAYAKSMLRHLMDFWLLHRDQGTARDDIETALCAIIFNAMGYLFNELTDYDG